MGKFNGLLIYIGEQHGSIISNNGRMFNPSIQEAHENSIEKKNPALAGLELVAGLGFEPRTFRL